jgi:hypothetical protein
MKLKTYYITDKYGRSGIGVAYTKSRKTISISGWYDGSVYIEGAEVSLIEFIKNVGIPKEDLEYAIKNME